MFLLTTAMLAASFHLHSGDRVVFYGDSITEQRLYTTYVEAFVLTRYPGLDVRFFNRGWGGDTSWGGGGGTTEERVRRDVAPLHPTVVTVMLGMNDAGYVPVDEKIGAVIKTCFGTLMGQLLGAAPAARFTVMGSSPWDDWAHGYASDGKPPEPWAPWHGYNSVIQHYEAVYRAEAARRGAAFVDFNAPLADVLQKAAKIDKGTAAQIVPDSIHPGPAGHVVMAGALLKAWGAEPVVSDVTLDVASGSVSARRAKVDALQGTEWTQTDESLPFCVDPGDATVRLAEGLSGFEAALNRQTLRVNGLDLGAYRLEIDGHEVARLTSAQLEQGVNLAAFDTPMRRQSLDVLSLVRRAADLEFTAWRQVGRENGDLSASKKAAEALEDMVTQLHMQARNKAKPVPHRFKLVKTAP